MKSAFLIFIFPILALILLTISIVLSPHSPYRKKNSAFVCVFHSFLTHMTPNSTSTWINE